MKPAVSLMFAVLLSAPSAFSRQSFRRLDTYTPLTAEDVKNVMPEANSDKINEYLPYLNDAMQKYDITTPDRQSAFLSQVASETGQLNYMTEIASGAAYNGRTDLGNTSPNDGETYKGRGALQLTGKDNYEKAGQALGVDLVNHPEIAATPQYAFETAGWYWDHKNLNEAADHSNINQVTKGVNGCTDCKDTHSEERSDFYQNAQNALGGHHSGTTTSNPKSGSTSGSATNTNNGGETHHSMFGGGHSSSGGSGSRWGDDDTPKSLLDDDDDDDDDN